MSYAIYMNLEVPAGTKSTAILLTTGIWSIQEKPSAPPFTRRTRWAIGRYARAQGLIDIPGVRIGRYPT